MQPGATRQVERFAETLCQRSHRRQPRPSLGSPPQVAEVDQEVEAKNQRQPRLSPRIDQRLRLDESGRRGRGITEATKEVGPAEENLTLQLALAEIEGLVDLLESL